MLFSFYLCGDLYGPPLTGVCARLSELPAVALAEVAPDLGRAAFSNQLLQGCAECWRRPLACVGLTLVTVAMSLAVDTI